MSEFYSQFYLLQYDVYAGAAVLVFRVNGRTILHCGDMRYHREMPTWPGWADLAPPPRPPPQHQPALHAVPAVPENAADSSTALPTLVAESSEQRQPALASFSSLLSSAPSSPSVPPPIGSGVVDLVYLDTTYADPKHDFPAQEDSCRFVADAVADALRDDARVNAMYANTNANVNAMFANANASNANTSANANVAATIGAGTHSAGSASHAGFHGLFGSGGSGGGSRSSSSSSSGSGQSGADTAAPFHPHPHPHSQPQRDHLRSSAPRQKTLFLVGTYQIGKERVLTEVAARCGLRVFAEPQARNRGGGPSIRGNHSKYVKIIVCIFISHHNIFEVNLCTMLRVLREICQGTVSTT